MSVEHLKAKQAIIDEIKGKLEKAQSCVIVDYMGITVEEADGMRKKLREADVDYTVYKNTLVKRAIDGTEYADLAQVLEGPSAVAISYDDAVAPARVLNGIIKDLKKMEFKAGVIEGTYFDAKGVVSIAGLPSRDEMIAKFMGSIQSPLSAAVRTLQAVADAKANGVDAAQDAGESKPEEQSETAAQQITTLITENSSQIERTFSIMQQQKERVGEGVTQVNHAGQKFDRIAELVQELSERVTSIESLTQSVRQGSTQTVSSVQEIKNASNEVRREAENVSAVSEEQAASTQEIAAASQTLSHLAQDLQKTVGHFRV